MTSCFHSVCIFLYYCQQCVTSNWSTSWLTFIIVSLFHCCQTGGREVTSHSDFFFIFNYPDYKWNYKKNWIIRTFWGRQNFANSVPNILCTLFFWKFELIYVSTLITLSYMSIILFFKVFYLSHCGKFYVITSAPSSTLLIHDFPCIICYLNHLLISNF